MLMSGYYSRSGLAIIRSLLLLLLLPWILSMITISMLWIKGVITYVVEKNRSKRPFLLPGQDVPGKKGKKVNERERKEKELVA
jgi:hypothetical protein